MIDELYFSAAVQIAPDVLPGKAKVRAARFWRLSQTPGMAWVILWPPCRMSKPFIFLVPIRAIELSGLPDEPPMMPDWTHGGAYEAVGCCMLPRPTVTNVTVETANHRLAALCARHTYAGRQPAWRGQQ